MPDEKATCPYCKEDILSGALKCKHCHSKLAAALPDHKGTCPYCMEAINAEAVKCKHCQSNLGQGTQSDCSCAPQPDGTELAFMRRRNGLGMTDGEYGACYIDCSFDYPEGSLAQNTCFLRCDRRFNSSIGSIFGR